MRISRILPMVAMLPLTLGGCGGAGSTPTPGASSTGQGVGAGQAWVTVVPGKATPSPGSSRAGSYPAALPPVSFLPTNGAGCAIAWPQDVGQVMIPLVVTPGPRSLKVTWPNRYGNTYRVTAVLQSLVTGAQPEPLWQTVTTGSECEASATVTGLTSGAAYIVWLDAPNTPRDVDGTRSLYTGRSRIVKPG